MNNHIASNSAPLLSSSLDRLSFLPDDLLLDRVHALVAKERSCTAQLVAHLAEVELRRLYLSRGCSSMFTYCTEVLHLSEAAAYARIEVARAVRRLPQLLDRLADGSLSLTAIRRLASVLTPDNCDRLLLEARHRTAREMDLIIARERPKPDARAMIRRLPTQTELVSRRVADGAPEAITRADTNANTNAEMIEPASESASSISSAEATATTAHPTRPPIQALAPERHRVQFTASSEMRERIERLQDLLRHRIPDGDLAAVIDTALIDLLTKLEKQKCGAVAERRAPRRRRAPGTRVADAGRARESEESEEGEGTTAPAEESPPAAERTPARSRTVPLAVRRAVWRRDAGRCDFVAADGKRCSTTGWLEFHHLAPFARGGESTPANLGLRCRAHNAHEAESAGLGRRGS